ncbi:DNA-processing protein DprA [Aeromonas jandaei]|uniref:DNA-processing protein DprA n=1 Tax=Aeromonas jandaei TaxID=650 RepID=UPI00191F305F|nr:DNA-processing protein DprA [Aeromonas jandaei]MBL0626530.1 DNA-processing protein DprA [Aeromonas jandaei]
MQVNVQNTSSFMSNKGYRESWYHAALILSKKIPVGSESANKKIKEMLLAFNSFEGIYQHFFGLISIDGKIKKQLDEQYGRINFQFHAININDVDYPDSLRNVENATPILYCKGDLALLKQKKTMAFVGTRELHDVRHIKHSESVIKRLVDAGYEAIVSGLATGSDTLGHQAAIKNGAKTIAVLGTSLNQYYPKENKELQDFIGKEHLLVSEYPIGINSFGSFFANRNRTTVGLATDGIIVARASDRSGTMYAIKHCLEQNKTLYILENNTMEPSYEWVSKYKEKIKVIREK